MDEILAFLVNYQIRIYAILGVGGVIYLRWVLISVKEWQGAAFGLEKESARHRFTNAMTGLLFFVIMAGVEFFLVSFLIPNRPKSTILATPTIDLLATPTATLVAGTKPAVTPTGLSLTLAAVTEQGCTPGVIEWTYPKNGGTLQGTVELKGTVQVPNLGFYKYEYSPVGQEKWVTIAAGNQRITDKTLGGQWNTAQSDITPGDYKLRLVVTDNQNKLMPACVINIRIISP
jgi:hypothetical protein